MKKLTHHDGSQLGVKAAFKDNARCGYQIRQPGSAVVGEQQNEDQELNSTYELFADGELALFARLLQLALCRFFCLLAFVRHQSPPSLIRAEIPFAATPS